ncbi:egl nine homolog 1 isoform X4 [Carassius gibelio]|uniref:egl nine homolog 1 isoform X4 n=1 Tax=Carassius gibelio TaxID=101364 RepID=UPI002278EDDC|nr:egl nine homolog 1 isoform X4 [Carassius gibelio]
MDQCTTALDPDQDKQFCELCGKMENLLKCGRCRISFYCSKEHQKQHWKEHKLTCIEADKTKTVPQTPHQQEKPTDPETKDLITRTASSEADSTTTKPQTHKLATDYIVPCMNKHGICVVDNFLGEDMGLSILENVKALQQSGKFTEGQLVSQKSDSTKDIRGDIITWIEGKEPGCEKICFLMSRMDDLVRNCNGKLGNYSINGRTKLRFPLTSIGLDCILQNIFFCLPTGPFSPDLLKPMHFNVIFILIYTCLLDCLINKSKNFNVIT